MIIWGVIFSTFNHTLQEISTKNFPGREVVGGRGGVGYSFIWPIQGCVTGQGMVFVLSVPNRVYKFVAPVLIINRMEFVSITCIKNTKAMTITGIWSIEIANKRLYKKKKRHAFFLCPKQGYKLEGIILYRVCILEFFLPNRVRVSKCQQFTMRFIYTWMLVEYPPPPPLSGNDQEW